MRLKNIIPKFHIWSVLLLFLNLSIFWACAGTGNSETQQIFTGTSADIEEDSSFAAIELKDSLQEPFSLRDSYIHYRYALQAMDNKEWILASHYLDVSLKLLVAERRDSTHFNAQDSAYSKNLLARLIRITDEIATQLPELGENAESWQPYEQSFEGLEENEALADSSSLQGIESFLDTLDFSQFSLPVELNERVLQEIYYFTERVPSFIASSLNRKTAYDSLIYGILREYEMPEDLIYLSLVESGFKVKAYSRAKASGLWQFIPATGERFGLKSDFWIDMRRNPEKATRAAAAYLTYLHNEFDDWLLAMAAYNCGEGRVRRLIREMKADSTRDTTKAITYWDLKLPKETMHYVPRILAAMIIGHFPEHYNIKIKQTYLPQYDTVSVEDCLPVSAIAKALSISEDSVHTLNPELVKWSTPPDEEIFVLRIPPGSRQRFLEAYAKMDKNMLPRWHYHKVKRGEYLGVISKRYGVSVADIQSANSMKTTRLRAGQRLLIPLPALPDSERGQGRKNIKTKKVRTHTVRAGENVAAVARRYGISVANLRKWNSISGSGNLQVDDVLFVSEPSQKMIRETFLKSASGLYEVQEGDTYASIAARFSVSAVALLTTNGGERNRLKVGQKLKIPESIKVTERKSSVKSAKPKTERTISQSTSNKKSAAKSKTSEKKKEKPSASSGIYVVRSGDNLSQIAVKTGVSVKDLQSWNQLKSEKIYVGQKLKIKSPKQKKTTRTHQVQKGESLWDIARKMGVTIEDLVKWNNLPSTRIRAGQTLIIEQ